VCVWRNTYKGRERDPVAESGAKAARFVAIRYLNKKTSRARAARPARVRVVPAGPGAARGALGALGAISGGSSGAEQSPA
jgi:hypothetical protein